MNNYKYEILTDGTIKITRYLGNDINITIPQYIDHYLVTAIGMEIFLENDDGWNIRESLVESIIVPDSVLTIGDFAFSHCYELEKIIIPKSVINIGRDILYDSQTVLYVYENSYALSYAINNHISYVIIKG
ncbi:MAG: leucine-rich repeat domain-containing protein [Erysipelotrichaceae bacterium]|nr:leucine-rich repeat domain-containing protein [Erysipelotrichaceae bacterium]